MTESQETMWHNRYKVIHNGVCQYGAAGGRADVKQKKPSREREGFGLEDIKRGPLYTVARGLYLLLRLSFYKARHFILPFLCHQRVDVSNLLIDSYDALI